MKTLILAEKPSQMRDYAQALGFSQNGDFYVKDNFIMYCALGHLIELANDTAYRPQGVWNTSYLPILPQLKDFIYVPKPNDTGRQKQLYNIEKLLNDPNISQIYVATDSDREGELIFRYIYNYFKCKKTFKRIWLSSLENNEIRNAFQNPKFQQGDSFLENLSKSAYARAIADWLIGVNATQSATLQLGQGKTLSIGRVQTAILKIICDRYIKNKNHQVSFSYKIITEHSYNGTTFFSESSVFDNKEQALNLYNNLFEHHSFVTFQKKIENEAPPLLHTLDSLTIVANKCFKYNPTQVLQSAQKLYESKLISYPRTEDPYITKEGFLKLKTYLLNLSERFLKVSDFSFSENPKSVDNSKIKGSHDAIIPTGQITGFENLSEQDKNIYNLILHRCLESFSVSAIYEKGIYVFENQNEVFKTHTSKLINLGWKKYSPKKQTFSEDENAEKQKNIVLNLPFVMGDKIAIENKNCKEIQSKPPAIYTPATLTADLSNLAKFLQEQNPNLYEELQQQINLNDLEIGTKGTRPSIIDNLVNTRKFITFENNKYTPTPLGLEFYHSIKNLEVAQVSQTAKMEYQLKQVAQGKLHISDFYNNLQENVKQIVSSILSLEKTINNQEKKGLGTCPKCKKGMIIEGKKAFGCSEYKNGCDFTIWKEVASKKLTTKNIEDLVQKQKTGLIKGFKSKAGKEFSAHIILDANYKTQFEFAKK